MPRRSIYVETRIAAPVELVWHRTQDPASHARWDVRFSSIRPTDRTSTGAQRFEYTRRVPFHVVRGIGISIGETARPDGSRTSALRFDTRDPLSPIRSGRGYWRYVPEGDGTRFITGYDYEPGWGPLLDRIVRPLLGWATAWSFDRLRIWIEHGEEPERWTLASALMPWQRRRPRASRCLRAPAHGSRRDDHLRHAPATLASLPAPSAEQPAAEPERSRGMR